MDLAAGVIPGPVLAAGIAGLMVAAVAWGLQASTARSMGGPTPVGTSAGRFGPVGRRAGPPGLAGAPLLVGLAIAVLVGMIGWSTGAFAGAGRTGAAPAASCPAPTFVLGFAALRARLGDTMGEPLECERVDPGTGDSLQQTTTGLAYYRRATNAPAFTDGYRHWALTADGLVRWEGDSVDPPSADGGVPPTVPATAAPQPASTPSAALPAESATDSPPPVLDSLAWRLPWAGEGMSLAVLAGCLALVGLLGFLVVRVRVIRARRLDRPTMASDSPPQAPESGEIGAAEMPRNSPSDPSSASSTPDRAADVDRYLEHENTGWEVISGRFGAAVMGPLCLADRTRLLYVPEGGAPSTSELVQGCHMPGGVHGRLRCPVCSRTYTFSEPDKDVAAATQEVEIIVDGRWKQRVGAVGATPEGAGTR